MADTETPTEQTNPLDVGTSTSEYATTKIVIYMGIASQVIGVATSILTAVQVLAPAWLWVGVALMIAGKLTALLKALGYDATRKAIKTAAINAAVAPAALPADAAAAKVFAPA